MNLNQYIKELQRLIKNNPKLGAAMVVAAADDEGNSFSPVLYAPTAGFYSDREFDTVGGDINAVCVN